MQDNTPDSLIRFAKNRAKKLRDYLATQGHLINHSQSLEATAKTDGFKDWNTYVARFKLVEMAVPSKKEAANTTAYPLQVGDAVSGAHRSANFSGTLLGLEKTITEGVWRTVIAFDKPLEIPGNPALKQSRRRIRLMLDMNGMSVNLKGKPDGHTVLNMP